MQPISLTVNEMSYVFGRCARWFRQKLKSGELVSVGNSDPVRIDLKHFLENPISFDSIHTHPKMRIPFRKDPRVVVSELRKCVGCNTSTVYRNMRHGVPIADYPIWIRNHDALLAETLERGGYNKCRIVLPLPKSTVHKARKIIAFYESAPSYLYSDLIRDGHTCALIDKTFVLTNPRTRHTIYVAEEEQKMLTEIAKRNGRSTSWILHNLICSEFYDLHLDS